MAHTRPLREATTGAAEIGFLIGGSIRLASGAAIDPYPLMLRALPPPLCAAAGAIVAGIAVNLTALPVLRRFASGRALPDGAYRAAGALSALAAFVGALVVVPPGGS